VKVGPGESIPRPSRRPFCRPFPQFVEALPNEVNISERTIENCLAEAADRGFATPVDG